MKVSGVVPIKQLDDEVSGFSVDASLGYFVWEDDVNRIVSTQITVLSADETLKKKFRLGDNVKVTLEVLDSESDDATEN
jgi:hypothetical protein